MNITQNTKISDLINKNKEVVDALASINKHFEKLRNPVLRKILASRVTIADAAKIGGSDIETFFNKLTPLGFVCTMEETKKTTSAMEQPQFYKSMDPSKITELDVRPILAGGKDPFNTIMDVLGKLPTDTILKLVNSFEAVPLIKILTKKGYDYFTVNSEDKLVVTYFKKTRELTPEVSAVHLSAEANQDFDKLLNAFGNSVVQLDVREFEMPQPMVKILNALEKLPKDHALFVQHKKIPQYLLPELAEQHFNWRIKEIAEGNVQLLIFR